MIRGGLAASAGISFWPRRVFFEMRICCIIFVLGVIRVLSGFALKN